MKLFNVIIGILFSFQLSFAQKDILTGKASIEEIENNKKYSWFKKGYKSYKPDEPAMKILKNNSTTLSFIVFGGIWCSDTQKSLPQFHKITDQAGVAEDKIALYLLDRSMKSEEGSEKPYNIKNVPTIIVFNNNTEIGKIVEFPKKSIEEDIAQFLSK